MFERFYRADRGPNRRMGSGLGLAIVAELAAAMGGTVRAESPVDDGGRFPLRRDVAAVAGRPASAVRRLTAPTRQLGGWAGAGRLVVVASPLVVGSTDPEAGGMPK